MLDGKPLILLTRPKDRNKCLAEYISKLGCNYIAEPMLEIAPVHNKNFNADKYEEFIFTSKYSVEHSYNFLDYIKNKKIYVVGEKTAEELKKKGILKIEYVAQNSRELQKYLNDSLNPIINNFVYICCKNKANNFYIDSKPIDTYITYRANKIDNFTENLLSYVQNIDIALFYSARTAENFCGLLRKYSLANRCKDMYALCISTRTAEKLKNVHISNIYVAKEPNYASMLENLDKLINRIKIIFEEK